MQDKESVHLSIPQLKAIIKESIKEEFKNINQTTILSAAQAAKHLGISLPTLHKWKQQELVPYHRIGGRIFFRAEELNEFIKSM